MSGLFTGRKEYDAAGNEIAHIVYNSDGSIDTRMEKQYDEAGNETESIDYRGDGTVSYRRVREYDEAGRVLKEAHYGENGELEDTYEYVYDPARYQGTGYTYDSEGKRLGQVEWTFDILGNVLTYETQIHKLFRDSSLMRKASCLTFSNFPTAHVA